MHSVWLDRGEAAGFQTGVKGKANAVITPSLLMREEEMVPMRHEEKKMPPLLLLKVSECLRVYWVPTPCGPVATHAVLPGMCGMSPAH